MLSPAPAFDEAVRLLETARGILVFTGAGTSAESGVPTFRDVGGIWSKHSLEDVATVAGFRRNPTLVWEFYEARRQQIATCTPNPGHVALARISTKKGHTTLVTQNVDGLHQRAGSRNVIEIHGNLWRVKCGGECGQVIEGFAQRENEFPPRCRCGDFLRPDVVWFGEALPESSWDAAMAAASECDVVFVVGTSGAVWPAAGIPLAAKRHGAVAIEINPDDTELTSSMDLVLRGPSGVVIPQLEVAILGRAAAGGRTAAGAAPVAADRARGAA